MLENATIDTSNLVVAEDFEPAADFQAWDRPLVDIVRFNPLAGECAIARVTPEMSEGWEVPAGFACPVRHLSREPFEGPLRFQLSAYDRNEYSAQTNRTYAYALKPSLEAIEIEGRPWAYVDDEVVTTVVNSLLEGRGRLGKPLTGGTIESYIGALARCASHTNRIGMTDIWFDAQAHIARGWGLASMLGSDGRRVDTSHLRTHMIRPLHEKTIARIEGVYLMDPAKWHRDGPSSRQGVQFANGRENGLRLIENLGLTVDVVGRFVVLDPNEEYIFPVLRTKGALFRNAHVFGRDILRWQAYAAHERKACVAKAKEIHGSNWDEPAELLVNGLASGVHVGSAVQPSVIQRDFRIVQERLSMFDDVPIPGPRGTMRIVRVYWHCYHDLRHTYAYAMYKAAKDRSDLFADDRIGFVQRRLGHADRSTTARIYLWPDQRKIASIGDHAVAGHRRLIDA